MPSIDTIRTVTIRGQADNVDQTRAALDRLTASIQAANQNLSQTRKVANDNAEGWRITGEGAVTAANHIRQAAEAAYVLSPAFRSLTHEAVALTGPALKAAGSALDALAAGIVTAVNVTGTGLVRLGTAAEAAFPALAVLAGGVKTVGAALEAFSPTLTGVAASILSRLLPALKLLSSALLIVDGVRLVAQAWELGNEKLKEYIALSEKATAAGLTTDFYQRIAKGAEQAKLPIDALTESFKKLTEAAAPVLGGTSAQNRLKELTKAGNFGGNSGVARLQGANSNEERLRALADLYDQAVRKGERLAGLDIVKAFGGEQLAANLAKSSDYLTKMVASADKLAAEELISAATIANAVELQNRYDAAVKILETRWHPIQDLLAQLGIKMREEWVGIVEAIAKAVDAVGRLAQKIAEAMAPMADFIKMAEGLLSKAVQAGGAALGPLGAGLQAGARVATFAASGSGVDEVAEQRVRDAQMADARRRLAEAMSRRFDTSQNPSKTVQDTASAYDRATGAVLKYIKVTEAAAQSVGKTVGEQEKAKVVAQLLAAAEKDGTTVTAAMRAEMDKLAERAGNAAQALEKAKVAADIKFSRDTALLSQEDVQIATALKGLYPDVATALGSVEAQAMRTNAAFKEMGQAIENNLTTGLTDIAMGTKSVSQGFADMANSIIRSIEQMIIKILIVQPLMQSLQGAISGGGFSLGSLFGGGSSPAASLANGTAALHGGGIVGAEATFWHSAGLSAFNDNTPRFHGGGIAGDEVPIIARRGEGVFTAGQMAALGKSAAPQITVNLIEDSSKGGQVTQSSNSNGGINIEAFVDSITAKNIGNPGSATRQTLGQAGRLASR